jgi:hypothetical protein
LDAATTEPGVDLLTSAGPAGFPACAGRSASDRRSRHLGELRSAFSAGSGDPRRALFWLDLAVLLVARRGRSSAASACVRIMGYGRAHTPNPVSHKQNAKPMPFDSYSPCPGGTGKKIKFCCPELLSELQKIERMLGGEQYLACLKQVERLEQSHPSKACLWSAKTMLLRAMERIDEAQAAAATFLEQYPESPVALAETAILCAATQGGREAMPTLAKAMAASDTELHDRVYGSPWQPGRLPRSS